MPGGLQGLMQGAGGDPGPQQGQGQPDPQQILQAFNALVQQGMDAQQAVQQVAQQMGMDPQQVAQILMQFAPPQQGGQGQPQQGGMGGGY